MPEFTHRRSIHGHPGIPPPFIEQPPHRALWSEAWTCEACDRYLAHVEGRAFTMPGGTVG